MNEDYHCAYEEIKRINKKYDLGLTNAEIEKFSVVAIF